MPEMTYAEVESSLLALIKWYTSRKDWFMVERLKNDLGRSMEEQEARSKS